MIEVARTDYARALYAAINSRGAPAFALQNGVVPTLQLDSHEHSAFPPYRPFFVEAFVSASVGNWGWCRIGIRPTAAADMRCVITRVELLCNDAASTVCLWNVRDNGPGPTTQLLRAYDFDREPVATTTPFRYDATIGEGYSEVNVGAVDPFGGLASNAFEFTTSWRGRDTQIVLRPGQEFVVRTVNVNVNFGVMISGRVYQG